MSGNSHIRDRLLTRDTVANIGDSMIDKRTLNKEMERKDIQALGLIMMELMEPDTSMLFPETITLKDPEKWPERTGIKAFLAATETASLDSLRSVPLHAFLFLYMN